MNNNSNVFINEELNISNKRINNNQFENIDKWKFYKYSKNFKSY